MEKAQQLIDKYHRNEITKNDLFDGILIGEKLTPKVLERLFLIYADAENTNETDWIDVRPLQKLKCGFEPENGCNWAGYDRGMGKTYIVERRLLHEKSGQVTHIRLRGKRDLDYTKAITVPQFVSDEYKRTKPRCRMCGKRHMVQVDHKVGPKELLIGKELSFDDFQPLCQSCNETKKQHCKKCKETGMRFDAKRILGYKVPFIKGTKTFDASIGWRVCEGCYWYDIKAFRSAA